MQTKLVLLGTGTPNACPNANGPSSAVVVGDRAYLVDFGPGVVRQASAAYFNRCLLYAPSHRPYRRVPGSDFYSVGAGAPGSIESFRAKGLTAHDRSYLTGL